MGKFKPNSDNIIGRHARKAAVIIEERGWVQGMEENQKGQVCLMGGFAHAISPIPKVQQNGLRSMFTTRFGQWMKEHYPRQLTDTDLILGDRGLTSAPAWNDSVFTSQEETLAWLRKFADDLDPQR